MIVRPPLTPRSAGAYACIPILAAFASNNCPDQSQRAFQLVCRAFARIEVSLIPDRACSTLYILNMLTPG